MTTPRPTGRRCAWCGKPGGTPLTLLVRFAETSGVRLHVDGSSYIHVPCAAKVRAAIRSTLSPSETNP